MAACLPQSLSQRAGWSSGQPISALMHRALAHPEVISLAAGFVDPATLPTELLAEAAHAVLSDQATARAALQYGSTPGLPFLREQLLDRQCRDDGLSLAACRRSVDQVVVTSGSNELLHLLADTLLDPGDIVLCASPSYFVFLGVLQNLGVWPVGVATDEAGLVPEALEQRLQELDASGDLPRVKALYLVSYFDNPASITLERQRRAQVLDTLLRWKSRQPIYLLEDCAYRELRYDGPDVPSLWSLDPTGEIVILTHTFSKSLSPGVRVGYGILPPALVEPVLAQKGNIDFGSAHLNQYLVSWVLQHERHEAHLTQLRTAYRVKRDAMLLALASCLENMPGAHWQIPHGGLYVWLTLPEWVDTGLDGPLFEAAADEGMIYVPGQYFYPGPAHEAPHNTMRLSFGVQPAERIRTGIEGLTRALRRVSARTGK